MFTGLMLSFLSSLVFFPLELPPWHWVGTTPTFTKPAAPPDYIDPDPVFLHRFFFEHPFAYVVIVTFVATLAASAYASLSLLLSLWTTNIYLVLGIPWLVHVGLNFLFGVLAIITGVDLVSCSPIVLSGAYISGWSSLVGSALQEYNFFVPLIWITVTATLLLLTYYVFMKRRDILN
ncbi:hypothetical protein DXX99_08370 [Ammonifex thiophilus]|uniref:Uncharacterized protein n=2 Tax=Ammonifex thiophilus TaxID=444093 RepID=A0A3D8P3P4_9THEO|nr:hypothetical protein DXX99_08370 [Ammonifex thiophilus]